MGKEWFSVANVTPLSKVPKGGRVHFIGVAGVAMGQLAVALSELGYRVSGSDKEFYEPMGSFLRRHSIALIDGYQSSSISGDIDLVVIGNAISYGHPEVDVVEKLNLPYTFFSGLLYEVIIQGKQSIVACGTHGKSTTTAMVAHILRELTLTPSFFIGGVVPSFERSLELGMGSLSVVEGDEYDSAFFAKVPKFSFYKPDIAIINAIEFDHADIYASAEIIEEQFTSLVASLPKSGTLICCTDFPRVRNLTSKWQQMFAGRVLDFGTSADAAIRITNRKARGFHQKFTLESPLHKSLVVNLPLSGEFNARNAAAAISACVVAGCDPEDTAKALSSFGGVKRRQELLFETENAVVVEDFAHHPTAVAEAIRAMKESFPQHTLWAVFEPRSNTSRKKVFQDDYVRAFSAADRSVLAEVQATSNDSADDLLDVSQLAKNIASQGTPCSCLENTESILDYLLSNTTERDLYLIMSNGSFNGIHSKLVESLRSSR
jgi:UDP-N-acetylmuramate: L-alanyl-gamma-D-glutamyl-meso-diaminopimelate ligase